MIIIEHNKNKPKCDTFNLPLKLLHKVYLLWSWDWIHSLSLIRDVTLYRVGDRHSHTGCRINITPSLVSHGLLLAVLLICIARISLFLQ